MLRHAMDINIERDKKIEFASFVFKELRFILYGSLFVIFLGLFSMWAWEKNNRFIFFQLLGCIVLLLIFLIGARIRLHGMFKKSLFLDHKSLNLVGELEKPNIELIAEINQH